MLDGGATHGLRTGAPVEMNSTAMTGWTSLRSRHVSSEAVQSAHQDC